MNLHGCTRRAISYPCFQSPFSYTSRRHGRKIDIPRILSILMPFRPLKNRSFFDTDLTLQIHLHSLVFTSTLCLVRLRDELVRSKVSDHRVRVRRSNTPQKNTYTYKLSDQLAVDFFNNQLMPIVYDGGIPLLGY